MVDKVCIFIDGENFRHSIVNLFGREFRQNEYLPKNADWGLFFQNLAQRAGTLKLMRTYWFAVEHLDFFPWKLPDLNDHGGIKDFCDKLNLRDESEFSEFTDEDIIRELRKRKGFIENRFDGWKTLQSGIAFKHSNIEFRRAGGIKYDLRKREFGQEKAVDVNLATTMITLSKIYDVAIIVSGDQDYVPAVQAVKDLGKIVINVAFQTSNGKLLPGGARRLNQHTDSSINIPYEDFKAYLNI